jgi:hypothetical protein
VLGTKPPSRGPADALASVPMPTIHNCHAAACGIPAGLQQQGRRPLHRILRESARQAVHFRAQSRAARGEAPAPRAEGTPTIHGGAQSSHRPRHSAGIPGLTARRTKDGRKPAVGLGMPGAGLTGPRSGKAPSERPAFQPYWGKPNVRNDKGRRWKRRHHSKPDPRHCLTRLRGAPGNRRSYRDQSSPCRVDSIFLGIQIERPIDALPCEI